MMVDRFVREVEKLIIELAGGDPYKALAGMTILASVMILIVLRLMFMEVPSD